MLGLASKLGGSRMPRAQPSKRLPVPEGCLLAPPDAPPLRTLRMQLAMHDEPRVTPRRVCRVLENITMKPNATDGSSPVHVHSKGRGLVQHLRSGRLQQQLHPLAARQQDPPQ